MKYHPGFPVVSLWRVCCIWLQVFPRSADRVLVFGHRLELIHLYQHRAALVWLVDTGLRFLGVAAETNTWDQAGSFNTFPTGLAGEFVRVSFVSVTVLRHNHFQEQQQVGGFGVSS